MDYSPWGCKDSDRTEVTWCAHTRKNKRLEGEVGDFVK